MIAGIGIDLVEIERVAAVLERHGDAFLRRILHPSENVDRVARADGATHLAGLFSAKEAVMKALGTGMTGAAFKEIAILNHPSGQPYAVLHGRAKKNEEKLGVTGWRISITHSKRSAAAVAVALRAPAQSP